MSNAVFPSSSTLPGLKWPVTRSPHFDTKIQETVSGIELRAALAAYPRWRWTLSFEVLRSYGSFTELKTLLNFYLARQGSYDSFLYDDPNDDAVTAQQFGTGDGATTAFQLLRSLTGSGFNEPIYNLNGTPSIFKDAVLQSTPGQYSISASGLVTFVAAPALNAVLTWTGSYYWRVRFEKDMQDFVNFASKFFSVDSLSFVSLVGS